MAIDKSIDYVEQDGSLNFIKNSKSVTVPKEFKARKNAPATKLAYITADEAKMLKKMKKGTPHKGPKGIPSYDSFGSIDASGRDTGVAGSRVSAAERGDFRGFEGSRNLPPGVQPKPSKEAQALRNAAIVAGAGQRVNPGFFDSRNVISPTELALARASNPNLFRKVRGGGIMDFIRGGGLTGSLIRGIGQGLGFGKRFNEPTYDMSQFNNLGLLTNRVNPSYYNDLDNEGLLSLIGTGGITDTMDLGNPLGDDRIPTEEKGIEGDGSYKISSLPNNFSSDVNPLFRNMIMQTGMNEKQKKKALQEMEFGVAPEKIMPKLQQLDDTKFFMKTDDRITSNDLIKFYEDRGIKLSDEQKMKIVKAAGEDI